MNAFLIIVIVIVVVGVAGLYYAHRRTKATNELRDSGTQARRWVERLGGQVYSLEPGDDDAARQALADASERFTAAGGQVQQATTREQYRLAALTAQEGLYYVRAARVALGLDPGPDLPALPGQREAGAIAEDRAVTVEGHQYRASMRATGATPHYHPGGSVAGRPIQRGWYSDPWWQSASDTGTWALSSYLIASSLFYGSVGDGWDGSYAAGDEAGQAETEASGDDPAVTSPDDYGSGADFDGGGDY